MTLLLLLSDRVLVIGLAHLHHLYNAELMQQNNVLVKMLLGPEPLPESMV